MATEKYLDKKVNYPDKDQRLLKGIENADIDRVREALSHGAHPKISPHAVEKYVLAFWQTQYDKTPETNIDRRANLKAIRGLIREAQEKRLKLMGEKQIRNVTTFPAPRTLRRPGNN